MVSSKGIFMGGFGMLQRLPRVLRAGQVILLSAVLLGTSMRVGGDVVEFRRPLVILVMRSIVITCGHKLKTHNLPGFCMGFLGKFISTLRVLQRALGMPVPGLIIALFVVLGRCAMCVCRPFVVFGRSSV
jgi:hypothetical protein